MTNKKLLLAITAASLTVSFPGTGVLAASTSVPKTQKIQETEGTVSSSSVAVERSEASTEALPNKGDSIAIGQNDNLSPLSSNTEAEALALQYAGLTAEEVTQLRTEVDQDDGRTEYEVEFQYGNLECSYEFDGDTGSFLKFSYEVIDKRLLTVLPDGAATIEDAAATALAQVEGAERDDLWIETDQDDGQSLYEGKIIYNNVEYEFEIDAASGAILDWSAESIFS